MKKCKFLSVVFLILAVVSTSSYAAQYPECTRRGQPMEVNNRQVLDWKTSTKNQYQDRGFVVGHVVQALQSRNSHLHLEIDLDPSSNDRADHIEIVYNKEFGAIPRFSQGSEAVVCGDYITSNQETKRYKPSPVGAIIHWVHMSPNPGRHDHGFMMLDGVLTGQENPNDKRGNQDLNNLGFDFLESLFASPATAAL
jgi:hypothetical protein